MKKNKFAALALILPVLAACTDKKDDPIPTDRTPLSVSAGIDVTRATESTWHQGDAIGVYTLTAETQTVYSNQANFKYTNATADGATANFSPVDADNTAYYPIDGSKLDILAYYPHGIEAGLVSALENGQLTVNATNQTSLPAIDLMTATKVEGKNQDAPSVALEFKHRLTKLLITLAKGEGIEDIDLTHAKVTISGTPASAVYDLFAQSFKSFGAATGIELKGSTAIVIPTTNNNGVSFTIEADGHTFKAPLPANITLGSGEEANLTITLKKGTATITGTIKPWTGGPTEELTAIDIDVPQGEMNIDEAITGFVLWKSGNEADKRTYTFIANQWSAAPAPFYTNEVAAGEVFKASATLGQPYPVTSLSDELTATGTATEAGKLSLEFSHIHSQVEFRLALAPGVTANLTGATIDLAGFTGFKADGTVYLLTATDWSGKALTVSLTGNKKYIRSAGFITQAGKKNVITITLDSSQIPAGITVTDIVDWGTPVAANTEISIDMGGGLSNLGALPAGIFNLVSNQGPSATYNYDGTTLVPTGSPLNWKDLNTGITHSFTLTYTSSTQKPEPDVIIFNASNIAWGNQIIFDAGQRQNSKFTVKLTAGIGYSQSDFTALQVTLSGFTTTPYTYSYQTAGQVNFVILKPQTALTSSHTVSISVGGHSYSIDLSQHFTKFEAGKEYVLEGTVNKTGLTGISIGTITDWAPGGTGTGDFEY